MRHGDGVPFFEGFESDEPLDMAALRADHELIEALIAGRVAGAVSRRSGRGAPSPDVDDELVGMLAAWVAEVRPDMLADGGHAGRAAAPADRPASAPVGVPAGPERPARQPRYARRLALAATVVVLTSSSLAIGAWEAEPGGTLWAVSKVFYAERARSIEAAAAVASGLDEARAAWRQGRRDEAAAAMTTVRDRLPAVLPAEGRDTLAHEHEMLVAAMSDQPSTPPPAIGPTTDPVPTTVGGPPRDPQAPAPAGKAELPVPPAIGPPGAAPPVPPAVPVEVRPGDPVGRPRGPGRPGPSALNDPARSADEVDGTAEKVAQTPPVPPVDRVPPAPRGFAERDSGDRDNAARRQAAREQAARDRAAREQAGRDQAARDQRVAPAPPPPARPREPTPSTSAAGSESAARGGGESAGAPRAPTGPKTAAGPNAAPAPRSAPPPAAAPTSPPDRPRSPLDRMGDLVSSGLNSLLRP